jgi:hypothetical protein
MENQPEPTPSRRLQFGLSSLLATAAMLALLFGYLRPFGPEAVAACGLVVLAAGLIGGMAGAVVGKNPDTVFWAVISAVVAYLGVVGFDLHHWSSEYAWPLVGIVAGTTVGAVGQGRPVRRTAFGSLAATAVFGTYVLVLFGPTADLRFELLSAVFAGALLGLIAELCGWFEKRTAIPRYVLATAFVVAAILGHWIVPRIIPGL